jgi:hypothetical protein
MQISEYDREESFMSGNREHKSDVFSMLLEDPKNALEIYNALNGTNYKDPSVVQIVLLNKGISLSVRNDAEFVIDFELNIYEHQSTYNPNMPLRGLVYFVEKLDEFIKGRDIYGRRLIKIPTPHFVVFYNGTEKRPEKEVLRLSDAFYHPTDDPELELKCTVYNINPGYNETLLQNCPVLRDYMTFVGKVRHNLDIRIDLEKAVDRAIEECIQEGVLVDFLKNRRKEVTKNMVLDYTWERREEMIRREEREQGRVFEIIRMSIKYNATKDEIITELVEELKMSKQQAEQYLKQYKK